MTAVEPRAASSVLLLRDGTDEVEILFVRRAKELKFMGGAWVFPGGALEEEDGDPAEELAWQRAGVREAEEESGILLPDPGLLVPLSRWITPEMVPMRFDTRFYLAATPPDVQATPDGREVEEAVWWTPTTALDLFTRNAAELHFPTIKQVELLSGLRDVETALAVNRGNEIVPILPRVAADDDGFEVLLPGDPGYEDAR